MLVLETETKLSYIQPNWPASLQVKAFQTTRLGGFAKGNQRSFSLGGMNVDAGSLEDIKANHQKLVADLEIEAFPPRWLKQMQGNQVVRLVSSETAVSYEADAVFTTESSVVCAVRTADCLPILLCDRSATVVAAIHGGWKGILAGIIEITVAALPVKASDLLAWFGPAIGPTRFEVGEDVFSLFVNYDERAEQCFIAKQPGKWLANLYQLARQRLLECGVEAIYGADYCTYTQEDLFFSYRRDAKRTGHMASLIWLD